ncbi:MAG: C45 family peptidase [Simkaniaceae bacterium]|nr:C45 family peptidase [Simkaniaceae bacterium]
MGCFLIGVTGNAYTVNGEALLGSVSDDPYDVRTFVRIMRPRVGFTHVGTELAVTRPPSFADRGYFCQEGDTSRGVNAAGLSFTCAILFETHSLTKRSHPISFSLLTKQLMDRCRNVEEAIRLFLSVDAVTPPFSVFLADSEGAIAHLEAGSFGIEVVSQYSKEKPGAIFAVNCYQSKNFVKYNDPKAIANNPDNNNGWRLERGQELCKKWQGKIDIRVISQILSDHANRGRDPESNPLLEAWGFSICNHGTKHKNSPDYPLPWGTVSAEILQPSSHNLHYCYGWPCGQKPEFGDQLYQENSWGSFQPFTIEGEMQEETIKILTNVEGKILSKR